MNLQKTKKKKQNNQRTEFNRVNNVCTIAPAVQPWPSRSLIDQHRRSRLVAFRAAKFANASARVAKICAPRETSRARNLSPAGGWQAHGCDVRRQRRRRRRRWVTQNYPRVRFHARSPHRGWSVSGSTRKKSGGWIGGDRTRWRELRVGLCLTTPSSTAGCIATTGCNFVSPRQN